MPENFDEYKRYKYAMENIHDIVWELDRNLVFTFMSPNSKAISGYEPDEMVGRCMLDFLSGESKIYIGGSMKKNYQKRLDGTMKDPVLYDVQFLNKDGSVIWFEVSVKPLFSKEGFIGYIGTSRDISEKKAYENEVKKYIEELERTNKELDRLAALDMLTGAYNRRKFEKDVTSAARKKEKNGAPFAIIMFDIDGFKKINDRYGHKGGDALLQEITSVVKQALRKTDKLFRWGGDEFVILLQDTEMKNAIKAAEKVRKAIEAYDFGIESGNITITLGVGEYRQNGNINQFLSCVDDALIKAKLTGKNRIEFQMGAG